MSNEINLPGLTIRYDSTSDRVVILDHATGAKTETTVQQLRNWAVRQIRANIGISEVK